jgi:hypothetical protein
VVGKDWFNREVLRRSGIPVAAYVGLALLSLTAARAFERPMLEPRREGGAAVCAIHRLHFSAARKATHNTSTTPHLYLYFNLATFLNTGRDAGKGIQLRRSAPVETFLCVRQSNNRCASLTPFLKAECGLHF